MSLMPMVFAFSRTVQHAMLRPLIPLFFCSIVIRLCMKTPSPVFFVPLARLRSFDFRFCVMNGAANPILFLVMDLIISPVMCASVSISALQLLSGLPKMMLNSLGPCCSARKHVKFNPRVTVCQDDSVLPVHLTEIEDVHLWPGKTWQLRRTRSSHRCAFVCDVSKLYAFLDPLVILPPLSQTAVSHDCPHVSQEPLSFSAVLIRESLNASGLQVSPTVAVQSGAHVDPHQHDPYVQKSLHSSILSDIPNSNHNFAGTQYGNDVSSFHAEQWQALQKIEILA